MRADEILKKRRDRAIAIVLSIKEREVDPLLATPAGREASKALRKVVLDQLNDFCEIALDVAASGDVATFEFNPEIWTRKINEIHRVVMNNGNH
jgi:hypothetical protein